eukprot:g16100.t1
MLNSRVGTGEQASGSGTRRRTAAPPPYSEDDNGMANIRSGATTRAGHSLRQQAPSAPAAQQAGGLPEIPSHPVPPPQDTTVMSSSSSSRAAAARAPSVAPAYTLPVRRSFRRPDEPVVVNQPAVYLFTDEYPFSAHQFDKQNENGLDRQQAAVVDESELPTMDATSRTLLQMTSGVADTLQEWDEECARKHLGAVKHSVATHKDLHDFTLMDDERPVNELELAGVEQPPGLGLTGVLTQQCRVVFTNKNRLVFTQANHTAEIGLPKMRFPLSLLTCFHDRWSHRKFNSYYGAINASNILQVFVQQTLTTSYQTSTCTFNDILDLIFCPTGGTMHSAKDIYGVTQTLGDHDQGGLMSRWDKTRFMRHALVIRYVDCARNRVMQTIAYAHPTTPASKLYEMARSIDASVTVGTADWLRHKNRITPFEGEFENTLPSPPLFQRKSYKGLTFVLLVIALSFLAVDTVAATFMILAVVVALLGSYSSSKAPRSVSNSNAGKILGGISKTLLGTQGGGLGTYVIAFFFAITDTGVSTTPT